MKVKALPKFEGIRDNERSKQEGKDIFPKAGDVWEVSEERANFLKSHGVIEFVEEEKEENLEAKIVNANKVEVRVIDEETGKIYEKEQKTKKKNKKASKK